ncbi:hypothetical protein [Streptomyces coerulescens]|uniref:Lipoprotein n=1 Tax=Streptomyces coerulescens TaxID=29304 RepID=A0ABW0CXN2_STRCD
MRTAAPLLTALALALTLAGCGQRSGPPASHPSPISSNDPRFLPLAVYDMPDDDGHTVGTARWTLAKECMTRLGFQGLRSLDIDPLPAWPRRPEGTGVVQLALYTSDDLRYGVQDPEQAARYGYQAARAEHEQSYPEKDRTLSEYLALTGEFVGEDPKSAHGHRIPRRGCLGEADRAIYGTNPQDRKDPVLDLETKSLQQGRRVPAWQVADRTWSACMRKAGYQYASPRDAEIGEDRQRQDLEERLTGASRDPDEPSVLEKRTATADARCKQETGYVGTVHAIDVRIQNELVARHRATLEAHRRWNDDATRRAEEILEDGS